MIYRPDLPRAEGQGFSVMYSTFDEMVAQADIFIVGTVTSVSPGRQAGSKFPIPTTVSELQVSEIGKGAVDKGSVIKVEQTGGAYRPAHAQEHATLSPGPLPAEAPDGAEPLAPGDPPDELLLELMDDPLFYSGDRVALALRWVPSLKVYQMVGPQGRFAVDDAGRVAPILADNEAVTDLVDVTVADLLREVRVLAPKSD